MALYYNGIMVSGINFTPRLTLAEYNALEVKPDYWIRTDVSSSDIDKIPASEINYDMGGGNYTTVQNAIAALQPFSMIIRSDISTLDDFVNLLSTSATGRGFIGNVNITQSIGVGVTGWVKVFAFANNPPDNGSYSVSMYCWFFQNRSDGDVRFCIIDGSTTGSYSVRTQDKFIGFNDKTFGITRGVSHTTAMPGYWAAMLNSNNSGQGSYPTLPTQNNWWHVLSMDWMGDLDDPTTTTDNWVTQLALPTQDSDGVWYRKNRAASQSIDSAYWSRLAEGDTVGRATGLAGKPIFTGEANSITFDFHYGMIYFIIVSISAGNGSRTYNPSMYIACTHANNVTDSLFYFKVAYSSASINITSATRAETGTNKFTLTSEDSRRWTIWTLFSV